MTELVTRGAGGPVDPHASAAVREACMFVGLMECDLLLGDVHSLKSKRAVLRPILAHLKRFDVSVAEVGDADLHRRARIAVAVVSGRVHVAERVLDDCERFVAENVDTELLAVRRRVIGMDD